MPSSTRFYVISNAVVTQDHTKLPLIPRLAGGRWGIQLMGRPDAHACPPQQDGAGRHRCRGVGGQLFAIHRTRRAFSQACRGRSRGGRWGNGVRFACLGSRGHGFSRQHRVGRSRFTRGRGSRPSACAARPSRVRSERISRPLYINKIFCARWPSTSVRSRGRPPGRAGWPRFGAHPPDAASQVPCRTHRQSACHR